MEEQKKEDCQSCKKGLSKSQWSIIGLSIYMLLTSLYGTYILISKLIDLF